MVTQFFMAMRPPTCTAQEKQVRVVHGKPQFYEPPPPAQSCALTSGSTGRNSRIQAVCGS